MPKITLPPTEATPPISPELRNNIYSALLSGPGIRNIESTLDRHLAESGFKDELRRYVTDLFRSGQATSAEEARNLAIDLIKAQLRGDDATAGEMTNGTATNGSANGVNGSGDDAAQKYDLKVCEKAITEGARTVRRELEKVCEITEDQQ